MRKIITAAEPPNLTLQPLLADGRNCLACLDVEDMEKVRLTKLKTFCGGLPSLGIDYHANDLFNTLDHGFFQMPPLEQLFEAEFAVWTRNSRQAQTLTLRFPDTILASRGGQLLNDPLLRQLFFIWLKKRRFLRGNHGNQPTLMA